MTYILLGLGGAIGACLRYAVSLTFFHPASSFPWTTLTVNLIGCLILGFLTSGIEKLVRLDAAYMFAFKTGLIGSFTTFSTVSTEAFVLFEHNHFLLAFIYIFVSAVFGLLFALLGMMIGERLTRKVVEK